MSHVSIKPVPHSNRQQWRVCVSLVYFLCDGPLDMERQGYSVVAVIMMCVMLSSCNVLHEMETGPESLLLSPY